jgi:hypothetical protein
MVVPVLPEVVVARKVEVDAILVAEEDVGCASVD